MPCERRNFLEIKAGITAMQPTSRQDGRSIMATWRGNRKPAAINHGGNRKDQRQIDNIGADDIAHGEGGLFFCNCGNGRYQLRERCADCNDRNADNPLGHTDKTGKLAALSIRSCAPKTMPTVPAINLTILRAISFAAGFCLSPASSSRSSSRMPSRASWIFSAMQ